MELSARPEIIDCGANIGLSVIYLKQLFPDAKIIAFEPDGRNFDLLKRNVESFNLSDVEVRKEAVWIANGPVSFMSSGSMDSRIDNQPNTANPPVPGVRLKEYLNKKIDFLKIDIEGAEYQVLMDIGEDLKNAKNVFIEFHCLYEQLKELKEIFELLENNGFTYYIKEAYPIFQHPFIQNKDAQVPFDVQLNIFGFHRQI
jgi:FkbM family methyltransferase